MSCLHESCRHCSCVQCHSIPKTSLYFHSLITLNAALLVRQSKTCTMRYTETLSTTIKDETALAHIATIRATFPSFLSPSMLSRRALGLFVDYGSSLSRRVTIIYMNGSEKNNRSHTNKQLNKRAAATCFHIHTLLQNPRSLQCGCQSSVFGGGHQNGFFTIYSRHQTPFYVIFQRNSSIIV